MDLPTIVITFTAYFLVVDITKDGDQFNLLLEKVGGNKYAAKDLVSYNTNFTDFESGKIYHLRFTADCVESYEILEGRGTRGWHPDDDWYINGKALHCSVTSSVQLVSNSTLEPCEFYSLNCDFRNIKPYPLREELKQHIQR